MRFYFEMVNEGSGERCELKRMLIKGQIQRTEGKKGVGGGVRVILTGGAGSRLGMAYLSL